MSYFLDGLYASCVSTFHLLYIALLGILIKKTNMVNDKFKTSLSKVLANIVLPCFIFSQIVKNFHINQMDLIYKAFIGCVSLYILGYIVGYISMKLLGYNSTQCRFIGAIYSSPHTTSIPVILVTIIGPVLDKFIAMPTNMPFNSERRAFLYIILNSIFSNIWKWSGCYYLIEPEEENENDYSYLEKKNDDLIIADESTIDKSNLKKKKKDEDEFTFSKFMSKVINMPIIICGVSLFITMIPPFQNFLIKPGGIMNSSLISVNNMIGKSYGCLVMMMLGISLSKCINFGEEPKTKSFFKTKDLIIMSLIKLIVIPLISFPFIIYIFKYILKADDVMLFLYLFMALAPSAINMIVICTVKGAYEDDIAMLMVIQYSISIITLTLGTTAIIYIIGNLNNVDMGVHFSNL